MAAHAFRSGFLLRRSGPGLREIASTQYPCLFAPRTTLPRRWPRSHAGRTQGLLHIGLKRKSSARGGPIRPVSTRIDTPRLPERNKSDAPLSASRKHIGDGSGPPSALSLRLWSAGRRRQLHARRAADLVARPAPIQKEV
jgi:hypothetical protein